MDRRTIIGNHVKKLHKCILTYMDKYVRHSRGTQIGPGLVENIELSLMEPICTVRWANDVLTKEHGRDLEVLS